MYEISLYRDAEEDLKRLYSQEPELFQKFTALFEQLEGDQDLLDRLSQHGYGECREADFSISMWQEQCNRRGRNLWRLKLWCLEDKKIRYRVIYAFVPRTYSYHILALAPREFNYDENNALGQRIIRAYEDLCS